MNVDKQRAFNSKMGKAKHYPRHQNLSKGGMVDKRKHFDDGGVATTATSPIAGAAGNGNTTQGGLIGGITQQSGYQAQLAPTTQLNYTPTIGAASTAALNPNDVNSAVTAEQGLTNQYANVAAGQGPNPALTLLNQQTGTNVANTAALQAGQRGGAANVGLLARQIGQQGAATQQQAVGQAATTQANQQLGALGAEAGLQNQIATQGLGEQGVAANVYGTGAGALNAQNSNLVGNYGQAQGLNQATALANTKNAAQTQGGLIGGIGSVFGFDKGGEVPHLDAGTPSTLNPNNAEIATGGAPTALSYVGKFAQGASSSKDDDEDPTGFKSLGKGIGHATGLSSIGQLKPGSPLQTSPTGGTGGASDSLVQPGSSPVSSAGGLAGNQAEGAATGGGLADLVLVYKGGEISKGPHKSHVANYLFAQGGGTEKVPALVSAKEVYLNPHQVQEVVERGADPMKIGHHFPGTDKVKKNSQENDVIPVDLDDGGVVLPISITTHKEASEKGRKFVERAHARRYMKNPKRN